MDDVALGSMVQLIRKHDFTEVPKIHFQYMQMTTPDPDFKNQVCLNSYICMILYLPSLYRYYIILY